MEAQQRIEIIDGALAESKRMKHLVNGLLLLAAYDSGGGVTRKSFRWRDVVDPIREYAKENLGPRHVDFEIDEDLGSGWGDADALQQMIERCVDNIRDHTPETARAQISVSKVDEEMVEISISDDGPGVSEKALPTLKSRFVRVDASRTDGKPGLGLSIADAIAGAHAGKLVVERFKPHGLRVVATIPRGKAGGRPERRRAPRPRKADDASKS